MTGDLPFVMKELSKKIPPSQELFLRTQDKHERGKEKIEELSTLNQTKEDQEGELATCRTDLETIRVKKEEAEAKKGQLVKEIEQLSRLEDRQSALAIEVRDIDQRIERSDVNRITDLKPIAEINAKSSREHLMRLRGKYSQRLPLVAIS